MQRFCFCCFRSVCIIITDIDCAARTLLCIYTEELPKSTQTLISLAFVVLPPFSVLCQLQLGQRWNWKPVPHPVITLLPILVWAFLSCYKHISHDPEMTLLNFFFFFSRIRSTGKPHLKSLPWASPSFNDIWIQIWIQASQLDSSVPIHLSF